MNEFELKLRTLRGLVVNYYGQVITRNFIGSVAVLKEINLYISACIIAAEQLFYA